MPAPSPKSGFIRSNAARFLTLFLFVQAGLFYGCSKPEVIPVKKPLAGVPGSFGSWQMVQEGVVEDEVQKVLKADELLTRTYATVDSLPAHLFVAYFKSQRMGQAPHSPKNCLPGNGWLPSVADTIPITIAGRSEPIDVNRYVVSKGDNKSVVLYWYQSRDRVVASEYRAKFFVVADALRYNRSDTALVRVVVPVRNNDVESANKTASDFVKSFYTPLREYFPA